MKVIEYGSRQAPLMTIFQCTAEPWWVFKPSAEELSGEFHILLFAADGHDESGTTFESVEKYAHDAAMYLQAQGVDHVDLMYGVSLGGATVVRFLAAESIPVTKAIIDAGITPYPYPKPVCRLIAAGDFLSVSLATKNRTVMELIAPPNRWTPAGENPTDHYDKIFDFEKNHYSYRTLYNSFWSANNYAMPDPVPAVDTYIEYWYGEGEKHARAKNCAYVKRVYPQTVSREFRGLMHAELVLMYPKLFREEILRIWNQKRSH
jgi:pimeloyl-ACP methyl ester carboxylesterase